ncbi:hypothetical protein Cadr_000001313 [Camelus dromedarius]|uniref:Uncharacterized protein n=1 Tax=Camelus dromedarius TaxID=9838 RepID=A0A5N4EG21_CAMDR|nr:hypothetical protein Cadr_000001313 [Camelus dromedarius]
MGQACCPPLSLPREVEVGPLRLLRSLIYIFCLFSHKLDVVHSLCFLFVSFRLTSEIGVLSPWFRDRVAVVTSTDGVDLPRCCAHPAVCYVCILVINGEPPPGCTAPSFRISSPLPCLHILGAPPPPPPRGS